MSEKLVIRLGSDGKSPVHWCIWSTDNRSLLASGRLDSAQQLPTLTERAGERPVIALVPSTDIKLMTVTLPSKPNAKLRAAIPFMIEDDIAEDIEQLFFAFGPTTGREQGVAVVKRNQLDEWIGLLSDAQLNCQHILPDALALPFEDNLPSAIAIDDCWLLRLGPWSTVAGELNWLLPVLEKHHQLQQETVPIQLYSEATTEITESSLAISSLPAELPMEQLAKGLATTPFNLLQGEYKIKQAVSDDTKQWAWVAGLAAVALLVTVVSKGVEAIQLTQRTSELSQQIATEYKQAFPRGGAPREGIMKRQIASQLGKLGNSGESTSFLILMTQLSSTFSEHQIRPQTLKFDANRNELRLQAVGKDFRSLEQFKVGIQDMGFEVTQGAINNKADFVVGSLVIKG